MGTGSSEPDDRNGSPGQHVLPSLPLSCSSASFSTCQSLCTFCAGPQQPVTLCAASAGAEGPDPAGRALTAARSLDTAIRRSGSLKPQCCPCGLTSAKSSSKSHHGSTEQNTVTVKPPRTRLPVREQDGIDSLFLFPLPG